MQDLNQEYSKQLQHVLQFLRSSVPVEELAKEVLKVYVAKKPPESFAQATSLVLMRTDIDKRLRAIKTIIVKRLTDHNINIKDIENTIQQRKEGKIKSK